MTWGNRDTHSVQYNTHKKVSQENKRKNFIADFRTLQTDLTLIKKKRERNLVVLYTRGEVVCYEVSCTLYAIYDDILDLSYSHLKCTYYVFKYLTPLNL